MVFCGCGACPGCLVLGLPLLLEASREQFVIHLTDLWCVARRVGDQAQDEGAEDECSSGRGRRGCANACGWTSGDSVACMPMPSPTPSLHHYPSCLRACRCTHRAPCAASTYEWHHGAPKPSTAAWYTYNALMLMMLKLVLGSC